MRSPGELRVLPDATAVAAALAELVAESAHSAIAQRGRFAISLAGGTTPRAAYERLAAEPYRSALPWEDVLVFFGDERCVPPEDAQSNYRMAREAFLNAVNVPERNVYRIRGEEPPEQAAASYAADLKRVLGDRPRFDLVLLGMGADGHTASLFPGADPMTDAGRLVRAVYSPSVQMWRITLTPNVLNAARCIVFAVEGSAKSDALAAVRNGPDDPSTYPAQIVAPKDGRLIWLVDAAAAGQESTS